jgi:hypothetical protein
LDGAGGWLIDPSTRSMNSWRTASDFYHGYYSTIVNSSLVCSRRGIHWFRRATRRIVWYYCYRRTRASTVPFEDAATTSGQENGLTPRVSRNAIITCLIRINDIIGASCAVYGITTYVRCVRNVSCVWNDRRARGGRTPVESEKLRPNATRAQGLGWESERRRWYAPMTVSCACAPPTYVMHYT